MNYLFYDKVAQKFGGYHSNIPRLYEFEGGDPEKIFKKVLLRVSGKNKIALDVGCADGRFTIEMSSYFKKIKAIDISKKMLVHAKKNLKASDKTNIEFAYQDVHALKKDSRMQYDIIYNRRGPCDYHMFAYSLKPGGYYAEINIGEHDAEKIKIIFGKGQNYPIPNFSLLNKSLKSLQKNTFKIISSEDFFYNEYYKSIKDFDRFLQGVPIIEDYDLKKDKDLLEKYLLSYTNPLKGICLHRHRFVLLALKK